MGNRLKVERRGGGGPSGERVDERVEVANEEWAATLEHWFGYRVELDDPPDRHSDRPRPVGR